MSPVATIRSMYKSENSDLDRKKARLESIIDEAGSAIVAFSGGVDSTLLCYITHQRLGERMLAVTAESATYPEFQINDAVAFAEGHGIPHVVIKSDELMIPEFATNTPDRCYHCKKELLTELKKLADERGFRWIFDGTNVDDHADYRPGMRAVKELGVRSPLAEAGFTKEEIRDLSRREELPTWDLPAYACLASRFPYGVGITKERLERVEKAEAVLRELGFKLFRVRFHGQVARVEISPEELPHALKPEMISRISRGVRAAGFTYAALDLDGYRQGSMNLALDKNNDGEESEE
jgi:uncharacterized protein